MAIRAKPRTARRAIRNPSPGVLPHMRPDYPIKPMIDAEAGEEFTIVSVRLDDGSYLAAIAEDQTISAKAKTRKQAEGNASRLFYEERHKQTSNRQLSPQELEDLADYNLAIKRRKQKGEIPFDRTGKSYGL